MFATVHEISGRTIRLRLADEADALFVLAVRLDPSRNKHVSPVADQRDWLRAYKLREAARTEFYYLITDLADEPLGTVRLYDFQGPSFCWGSWILKPGAPIVAAMESALLVYEIAFGMLGFTASHFSVRIANERVWQFHERMGARRIRTSGVDHFYEYGVADYRVVRLRYAKFLPSAAERLWERAAPLSTGTG